MYKGLRKALVCKRKGDMPLFDLHGNSMGWLVLQVEKCFLIEIVSWIAGYRVFYTQELEKRSLLACHSGCGERMRVSHHGGERMTRCGSEYMG